MFSSSIVDLVVRKLLHVQTRELFTYVIVVGMLFRPDFDSFQIDSFDAIHWTKPAQLRRASRSTEKVFALDENNWKKSKKSTTFWLCLRLLSEPFWNLGNELILKPINDTTASYRKKAICDWNSWAKDRLDWPSGSFSMLSEPFPNLGKYLIRFQSTKRLQWRIPGRSFLDENSKSEDPPIPSRASRESMLSISFHFHR